MSISVLNLPSRVMITSHLKNILTITSIAGAQVNIIYDGKTETHSFTSESLTQEFSWVSLSASTITFMYNSTIYKTLTIPAETVEKHVITFHPYAYLASVQDSSNNLPYIDTKLYVSDLSSLELVYQLPSASAQYLWGARQSNTIRYYARSSYLYYYSNNYSLAYVKNTKYTLSTIINTSSWLQRTDSQTIRDGTLTTPSTTNFVAYPACIFGYNNAGTITKSLDDTQIYSATFDAAVDTSSALTSHTFLPCEWKDNSVGGIGMIDINSNTLYLNSNTAGGSFDGGEFA